MEALLIIGQVYEMSGAVVPPWAHGELSRLGVKYAQVFCGRADGALAQK
jgi:hypothetical protein